MITCIHLFAKGKFPLEQTHLPLLLSHCGTTKQTFTRDKAEIGEEGNINFNTRDETHYLIWRSKTLHCNPFKIIKQK